MVQRATDADHNEGITQSALDRKGQKSGKRSSEPSAGRINAPSATSFKPILQGREHSRLRRDFPHVALAESEEEFDPNELKLLPVLATDRNAKRVNDLQRQQKKLMKSSKRMNDPKFFHQNGKPKRQNHLNSSFYKNRGGGDIRMDQLSPFRASVES